MESTTQRLGSRTWNVSTQSRLLKKIPQLISYFPEELLTFEFRKSFDLQVIIRPSEVYEFSTPP